MTPIEIERALAQIVIAKNEECKRKLASVDKQNLTERKALALESGIYDLCLNGGLLLANKDREAALRLKMRVLPNFIKRYPDLQAKFEQADENEKLRIVASLYGEIWMFDQIVLKYQNELEKATACNDAKGVFEANLKLDVVKDVLDDWQNWRKENGVYAEWEHTK